MKCWDLSIKEYCRCSSRIVACIGYFDGLHRGHQELIRQTIALSEKLQAESALITFDPDPWVTIKGIREIKHISTMEQRKERAALLGIENFFILHFDAEMAALQPDSFMDYLLGQIDLAGLVCGFDFHYGAKGKGSVESLKAIAAGRFQFVHVDSVNDECGKISSSRIACCLEQGKVSEAKTLLGYPYTISGKVIHGNAKGSSTLGFPTANCDVDPEFILPARGVYIGRVRVTGKEYPAMINIGHNPTFNERHMISVEAYILNFNHNIYGEAIEVAFYAMIRKEKKFASVEELIVQLKNDAEATASYFDNES